MQLGYFAEEVLTAKPPLQVLFICGANPAAQLPDSANVHKALAHIPFKISLEHFLTDTAAQCELVLPVTYFTEAEDLITSGMWNSSLKYVSKCVEPLAECKSEFTIFQELAKLMGLNGYPDLTTTAWLTRAAAKLAVYNLSFTALQKRDIWTARCKNKCLGLIAISDPDGKFQCLDKEQLRKINSLKKIGLQHKMKCC